MTDGNTIQPERPAALWWRSTGVPILVLSLVVWGVFGVSLRNRLVFDDLETIKNNTTIANLQDLSVLFSTDYFTRTGEFSYRPVVTFSYFLDHAIAGKAAWIYHAHNALLHHLNVLLVFALLNLLWAPRACSFAIALVFAIHPLHAEAVIFPGFREDLQMTFGMLALGCCLQADRRETRTTWIAGATLAYAFALFAKEGALLAPLIWCVPDLIQNRRALMPISLRRRYVPLAIVALAYLVIRFAVMANPVADELGVIETIALKDRLLTAPYLFAHYLKKFIWPYPLCIISTVEPLHDAGAVFQISVGAAAGFAAIWLLVARREPWLWPAGLWAAAAFAPVANIYPIANLWAERFYYGVGVGTSAIAVAAVAALWKAVASRLDPLRRPSIASVGYIALILIAWAAALTDFVRVMECRTSLSLWRRTVRSVPTNGTALYSLAKYEVDAGNYDRVEALAPDLERHSPWIFGVHSILGENAFQQGKWSEAAAHFEKASGVPPPHTPAAGIPVAARLVRSYLQLGLRERALSVLQRSIEQNPGNAVLMELQRQIEK